ncbi:MAG: bifunctional nicotinamidase/pyrazinamidase [Planctomycetes bacterium]|nr:bifunctional nicotinamidase/pyrazinamidase [Planctomycetota bacterium]
MRALILVDIQNDFCPGGALAVRDGDAVVSPANRLMDACEVIVATQDWHPRDHGSFADNHPGRKPFELAELAGLAQVLWPAHCVQGTPGADFHPALDRARIQRVFPKGTDPAVDSYSGFFDNGRRRSTGLGEWLRERGVDEVVLAGLATDYCVKATALDALASGFRTTVVADACRAVDLNPGDGERALTEMRAAGCVIATVAGIAHIQEGAMTTVPRDRRSENP